MDESIVSQRLKAFHAKHGPESYSDGGRIYYANGSTRETNPLGLLYDATILDVRRADFEWEVQSNVVRFYQLKLQQAVREFDETHTRLDYGGVPADPDAEIAKLQRLQLVVTQRKEELTKAEAVLAQTKWGRARQSARESQQERAQQIVDFQQRRRAIRI